MTTCWIIEQGEYSSYHVVGIFTSRENAEKALALINYNEEWNKASIDERMLDPGIAELNKGLKIFSVIIRETGADAFEKHDLDVYSHGNWSNPLGSRYYVWAKDEHHAIKIANERHTQWFLEPKQ